MECFHGNITPMVAIWGYLYICSYKALSISTKLLLREFPAELPPHRVPSSVLASHSSSRLAAAGISKHLVELNVC